MVIEVNANEHLPKHQQPLLELTVLGWNGAGGMAAESLLNLKLFATTYIKSEYRLLKLTWSQLQKRMRP